MDLFFIASKIGWFFLTPSNLLILGMVAGIGLLRWERTRRIGIRIAAAAALAATVIVLLPIGDALLRTIERRFPPYVACGADEGPPLAGILLLGGAISSQEIDGRITENLGPSTDRIRLAARLAKTHPELPLLVSGGQAFKRAGSRSEADATADLLVELGVPRDRLILETESRTTAENAAFASRQARTGRWLLVTSAFHMPRSIGVFRKAEVDVIAVPSDWEVDDNRPLLTNSAIDRLSRLDLAVREYLGLTAYWITGRTSDLLPGPRKEDACPSLR